MIREKAFRKMGAANIEMKKFLQRLFIYIAIILLGGVLGANVYNSIVDAPNWGSAIPGSIETARNYFATADPGTFFRVISPAAQISALIALVMVWPAGWRVWAIACAALLFAISGDVLTYAYFYPRNAIMFTGEGRSIEELRNAWLGWSTVNWLRSGICLLALVAELAAMSAFEGRQQRD